MNGKRTELRRAQAEDLAAIAALLADCGLPAGDLSEVLLVSFCVAETDGRIVGVAGVEAFANHGLLRSLAVERSMRGGGLAARLLDWCEAEARRLGVEAVYLLTTTAADYFRRRGYAEVPRERVPAAVAGHAQFVRLCPLSAICLEKRL